jgi:hypothetical protein
MMDRRLLLDASWSPANAGPAAWYYAAGQFVSLNALGVVAWHDRLANGGDLIQVNVIDQPQWEATGGWSSSKPSLLFAAKSLNSPSGGLAPIEAMFTGLNRPFTVLATCQVTSFADITTIASWSVASQVADQRCQVTTAQLLSSFRESDSSSTASLTSTAPPIGSGHVRLAYTFGGTTMSLYLGATLVGSDPNFDVGTCTFDKFSLGSSTSAVRFTEVVVYPRALLPREIELYSEYSRNEWGP